MENYNQTSGNGNRPNNQESQSQLDNPSSHQEGQNDSVDQQWVNNQGQNNQESQSQLDNPSSQQEGQNKQSVSINDMPEIKPETNQGGL